MKTFTRDPCPSTHVGKSPKPSREQVLVSMGLPWRPQELTDCWEVDSFLGCSGEAHLPTEQFHSAHLQRHGLQNALGSILPHRSKLEARQPTRPASGGRGSRSQSFDAMNTATAVKKKQGRVRSLRGLLHQHGCEIKQKTTCLAWL